jgi:hypothetical protein
MSRGWILTVLLAALVLGACGEGRKQANDRSSLSGRIAFDNFEDVWTIDADGTGLTRLTHRQGPDLDPSWSPDGTQSPIDPNEAASRRSGSWTATERTSGG